MLLIGLKAKFLIGVSKMNQNKVLLIHNLNNLQIEQNKIFFELRKYSETTNIDLKYGYSRELQLLEGSSQMIFNILNNFLSNSEAQNEF